MRKSSKKIDIKEIESKTLLSKSRKIDSWFLSKFSMNIYRGCQHACVYCDGRSEKYQVEGQFGKNVTVKTNASELLQQELEKQFQKNQSKPGFIMIGGGVGDSYQPIEKDYQLTRKILTIINKYQIPIHILTKSTLIQRDIEIIKSINNQKAIVSMSFSSVDDKISKLFEPGVPPPSQRLAVLKNFKEAGLICGMYLMPTIPYITDTPGKIESCFKKAGQIGLDFIVYAGLTLKEGRQKQFFYNFLEQNFPDLIEDYDELYDNSDKWGAPDSDYMGSYGRYLLSLSRKYKIPIRLPLDLVSDFITPKDQVIATLEQIDYLRKMMGQKSSFGYTANNISRIKEDLYQVRHCLQTIKGVGPVTERIIQDILNTGNSSYYEKLLRG